MVTLTENAVKKVQSFFKSDPDTKGKCLRVGVEPGGCSGYEYAFSFDDKNAEDTAIELDGFTAVIAPNAMPFLKGAQIDYYQNSTGEGFEIKNPNAKSSCGCGKSTQY